MDIFTNMFTLKKSRQLPLTFHSYRYASYVKRNWKKIGVVIATPSHELDPPM